ncbi:MAG: helicase-associated domain-containing protein [Candidatus Brocadiia bacterium]
MHLDEFLNERSIASLQKLQLAWAPATARSSSKQELLRLLRQQMLSPERAAACFLDLAPRERELLGLLLRQEGYEGDMALLARRLSYRLDSPQAQRQVLDELSYRGFVHYAATKSWSQATSFRVLVPQELGDALCEALNLDTREPALMLSLAHYLEQLEPAERDRLAATHGGDEPLLARLTRWEGVEERIEGLAEPGLQRAVRTALEYHAGVLPVEEFASHGLETGPVDSPSWREALEEALLGTFGHLSLLDYGIGEEDDDCLVVYQELVAAQARGEARAEATMDEVWACGIDFLTDLASTVDFVRANPARLTSAGRLFKGARNQLRPRTALHATFFMDEDALLTYKLSVAQELGLLELREDGRLYATRSSLEWEATSLPDQARSVLEVMQGLVEAPLAAHLSAVVQTATDLLLELPPDAWVGAYPFVGGAVARYLLDRIEEEEAAPAQEEPQEPWPGAFEYFLRAPSLSDIAAATRRDALRALHYVGLADVGRRADRTFVRASPVAGAILGREEAPRPGAILMVNPDFEVMLFPEPGHVALLHRLCAFCEREKSEVTLHLRITRESVRRAVLRGLDAEGMVATLRQHCRVPLPQNIEYSVRTWADSVHPAEVRTCHVLELPRAELVDAVLQLPQVRPLVERRLSPTAAVLRRKHLGPEAEEALKELGIHLM